MYLAYSRLQYAFCRLLSTSEFDFLEAYLASYILCCHSMHWGINPPQKHHPLFFAKPPLKSASCPSPPFLGNSTLYVVFLVNPPKNQIFQWTPILKFFILNPSYLLKLSSSSSPPHPLFENLVGGSTSLQQREGCTLWLLVIFHIIQPLCRLQHLKPIFLEICLWLLAHFLFILVH